MKSIIDIETSAESFKYFLRPMTTVGFLENRETSSFNNFDDSVNAYKKNTTKIILRRYRIIEVLP